MSDVKPSGWIGVVLKEKWRIDARIARGGVATVFRATDVSPEGGPNVAVKIMHPEYSRNVEVRRRFRREGYAANKVDHPGCVRVIADDSTPEGSAYIVMDLAPGEELEILREKAGGRLPYLQVARACDQVLDVLAAAHEKGIIHRDIKPENVLLTPDGTVKVLDFGIAHFKETALADEVTATGLVLGTPEYMSPEQALGKKGSIDAKTDIFATGAMMFTLLSGQAVHISDVLSLLLQAQATRQARSLYAAARDVPRELIAVVDKALMLEKNQRWPSARAMQEALRKAVPQITGASAAIGAEPKTTPKAPAAAAAATIADAEPKTMPKAAAAAAAAVSTSAIAADPITMARRPSRAPLPLPSANRAGVSAPPPRARSSASVMPPAQRRAPPPPVVEATPASQPTNVMVGVGPLANVVDEEDGGPLSGPTQILATPQAMAAKRKTEQERREKQEAEDQEEAEDADNPTLGMLGAPVRANEPKEDMEATHRIESSPNLEPPPPPAPPTPKPLPKPAPVVSSDEQDRTRDHDLAALLDQQRTMDLGQFRGQLGQPPQPQQPFDPREQPVTPNRPFAPPMQQQQHGLPQTPFGAWMPHDPNGPPLPQPPNARVQKSTVPTRSSTSQPSMLALTALGMIVFIMVMIAGCLFMRR